MKSKKINIDFKKLCIIIVSIIIVMIIKPPIKYHKVNEKFYKEHGIEYNIVPCPECGRDVADVQQFCYNCGAVLFDADERTLEALDKIRESLKPTISEIIWSFAKKLFIYLILISIIYCSISKIQKIIEKHLHK